MNNINLTKTNKPLSKIKPNLGGMILGLGLSPLCLTALPKFKMTAVTINTNFFVCWCFNIS